MIVTEHMSIGGYVQHLLCRLCYHLTIDVRMAEDEFVGLFLTDISHVKVAFFLTD